MSRRATIEAQLAEAQRAVGGDWSLHGALPGGWNEGAWLVRSTAAEQAVLKVHTREQQRVLAAEARVAAARAHGWPTPEWLATGRLASGAVWVLQAYVRGSRPAHLDARVARGLIEALEVQLGLGDGVPGWGEWARGVVFDDWSEYRARVAAGFPRGSEIVRIVDAIASTCAGAVLAETDLVHGNFGVMNAVDDGERIWLVDVHNLGSGPVPYDVAEAVLTALARRSATSPGLEALWTWAVDRLAPSDIATCTGSVALTMAEAYIRLDRLGDAANAAPGIVDVLTRAYALVR